MTRRQEYALSCQFAVGATLAVAMAMLAACYAPPPPTRVVDPTAGRPSQSERPASTKGRLPGSVVAAKLGSSRMPKSSTSCNPALLQARDQPRHCPHPFLLAHKRNLPPGPRLRTEWKTVYIVAVQTHVENRPECWSTHMGSTSAIVGWERWHPT